MVKIGELEAVIEVKGTEKAAAGVRSVQVALKEAGKEAEKAGGKFEGIGEKAGKGSEDLGAKFEKAGKRVKGSTDIIKESVETMSSEIIESFGIDGDIANALATQMVGVGNVAVIAGVAMVGAVAATAALTVAMAKLGGELVGTSQFLGVSVEDLQRYRALAGGAGADSEVFVAALGRLKERAKEAAAGNVNLAGTLQAVGVSAGDAARNPARAFESFLDTLQKIPDAQQRLAVVQNVLGDVSDDTARAILAVTNNYGALRVAMAGMGTITAEQAEQLAMLDRQWNVLTETAENFGKRAGIEILKLVGQAALGASAYVALRDGANDAGAATARFSSEQGAAAGATAGTTGAVTQQTAAIQQLTGALAAVRIASMQKGIGEELQAIAFQARNAGEAALALKKRLALDDDFYATVSKTQQYKKNLEELNKVIDPPARTGGGRARSARPASTARADVLPFDASGALKQALDAEINLRNAAAQQRYDVEQRASERELTALQARYDSGLLSVRAYYDARQAIQQRAGDAEIAEQRRLIGVEGERVAIEQARTKAQIDRINAEAAARTRALGAKASERDKAAIEADRLAKVQAAELQLQAVRDTNGAKVIEVETRILGLQARRLELAEATAAEEARAYADIQATFNDLQGELLRLQGLDVEATGFELGQKFAAAMARAVKEGRGDIVAAVEAISGVQLNLAKSRDASRRGDVLQSQLQTEQARLQNEVAAGTLSEVEARRLYIQAQRAMRDGIIAELETQRQLAVARKDAAAAAQIELEIERAKGLGIDTDRVQRLQAFEDQLSQGFDGIIAALARGGSGLKAAGLQIVNDIFSTLISQFISKATGGGANSFGGLLGGLLGGLFGGGFADGGSPPMGRVSVVGERGPEWFVPSEPGRILTADDVMQAFAGGQGGRGGTNINMPISFTVNAPGGKVPQETQRQLAARVGRAVQQATERQ